jgi:hypothetical protein
VIEQDEGMKLAAASALEKKVHGVLATDPARVSVVEELAKNGLRPLVEILSAKSSSAQLLCRSVVILRAIFNGTRMHAVPRACSQPTMS